MRAAVARTSVRVLPLAMLQKAAVKRPRRARKPS